MLFHVRSSLNIDSLLELLAKIIYILEITYLHSRIGVRNIRNERKLSYCIVYTDLSFYFTERNSLPCPNYSTLCTSEA